MDAKGKVWRTRKKELLEAIAESNSSFLSALKLPKYIHNSIYAQLKA